VYWGGTVDTVREVLRFLDSDDACLMLAEVMRPADEADDDDGSLPALHRRTHGGAKEYREYAQIRALVSHGVSLPSHDPYPVRQPTGRPNGRPVWGESRPGLIAARLCAGVDQLWTIDELRECVPGAGGPVPKALRWRRTMLSLVVANMRDESGDRCTPAGIAETLKCSVQTVERLASAGREAWTRTPAR
jgi:hypothetical protein